MLRFSHRCDAFTGARCCCPAWLVAMSVSCRKVFVAQVCKQISASLCVTVWGGQFQTLSFPTKNQKHLAKNLMHILRSSQQWLFKNHTVVFYEHHLPSSPPCLELILCVVHGQVTRFYFWVCHQLIEYDCTNLKPNVSIPSSVKGDNNACFCCFTDHCVQQIPYPICFNSLFANVFTSLLCTSCLWKYPVNSIP